jgi:glycosyltransferase involved in cell wall biosynthesis
MKQNVLVFCSWLDVDTVIGNFFVEQSEIMSDFYNFTLIVFKQNNSSIKKLNHTKKFSIVEKRTNKGLLVLELNYPFNINYPSFVCQYFKNEALKLLNSYIEKKQMNVSLIHVQSIFDAGFWAYDYSIKFKVPYIITEHNQLSFYSVDKKKCELVKKMLLKASKICVVSNDKARQFITNGLYFDFENVGNLINKRFIYLPKLNSKKKRIITIGAYNFLKDQKTIIKALTILDKKLEFKIDFVWIGFDGWGGNYKNEIYELFSKADLKNIDIILIPLATREEVADELQNADVFIFSSLSEGMPVSVLEALACGLPVFTTNCGGVDEFINESNGAIYQIKDYERLADLIFDFLEEKIQFNNALISNHIIERYGEEAFKNKILKIYQEII